MMNKNNNTIGTVREMENEWNNETFHTKGRTIFSNRYVMEDEEVWRIPDTIDGPNEKAIVEYLQNLKECLNERYKMVDNMIRQSNHSEEIARAFEVTTVMLEEIGTDMEQRSKAGNKQMWKNKIKSMRKVLAALEEGQNLAKELGSWIYCGTIDATSRNNLLNLLRNGVVLSKWVVTGTAG